jgi:deoxyribodipyrimidine photolyase-related protein
MKDVEVFFDRRKTYFQTDFYIQQRKTRKLLLQADGSPEGGSWSYDADNRKRFPKAETVPAIPFSTDNEWLAEARDYVEKYFASNYGSIEAPHLFAITHLDAEKHLKDFILHRFEKFGVYEDALVSGEPVLYHSVLSPMLNTGLITPQQVLQKALAAKNENKIPLNSAEGFVRQVIGWREFIRIVYEREGSRQRTMNYWQFTRKIPASFWQGETGIVPVDITVKKLLRYGYNHHIGRLMVLGNFMLLCEFDPGEVYRWFMEMYIDAYDWVMVPNVYGMTQFADGGLMTTKPYISGSNYLLKMGDYRSGEWQQIWDALFWRFMHVHRQFFEKNPRLSMLLKTFDKWPADKRNAILTTADNYLKTLDNATGKY